MIDATGIAGVLGALSEWLKTLSTRRARARDQHKHALLSVYTACSESKSYMNGLKLRKSADTEREARLARLWSEAAVELRRIDKDLAAKCLLLSDAVTESTSWDSREIDRVRDAVRETFERARRLL